MEKYLGGVIMKKITIVFVVLVFLTGSIFAQGEAETKEATYPSADIQFVVPFPVGGSLNKTSCSAASPVPAEL
jgi:tripartite-type tricarboxylate transporter receptor subunit TctC